MTEKSILTEDVDIQQLFNDMYEKAKEINPSMIDDIASYNSNTASLQSLQAYVASLNEPPYYATSNSVTP